MEWAEWTTNFKKFYNPHMTSKLSELIQAVNLELEKSRKIYEHAKKSAQEVAASAALSPSQSGDRFHSQGAADLAKQKFEAAMALKKELDEKKEDAGFILEGEEIFIVDSPMVIKGFKLVSAKSPIGKKLLNDKI